MFLLPLSTYCVQLAVNSIVIFKQNFGILPPNKLVSTVHLQGPLSCRNVLQLHHGDGGQQRPAHRRGPQLPPPPPRHPQHAHMGRSLGHT